MLSAIMLNVIRLGDVVLSPMAYYANLLVTAQKSLITFVPGDTYSVFFEPLATAETGVNIIKLFSSALMGDKNKLECLFLQIVLG